MSPRMRPSATRKSIPSSATVVPKVLRRPRASMQAAMASALFRIGRGCAGGRRQELLGGEAEPVNGRVDPGPLLREELLPFALQERIARAEIDEHATPSFSLDELFVDQLLIALQDRQRIDA